MDLYYLERQMVDNHHKLNEEIQSIYVQNEMKRNITFSRGLRRKKKSDFRNRKSLKKPMPSETDTV